MDHNRRLAYYILRDVEENKAYSHIALSRSLKNADPQSIPFIKELVYGVTRYKMYLDFVISSYIKGSIGKVKPSDLILLRMGLFQLIYMNKVPSHSAVDETVELAKVFSVGRQGFINAILREYLRNPDKVQLPDPKEDLVKYLSIKYSFEPWIVFMWIRELGEDEARALLEASNTIPSVTIRANTLKTNGKHLYDRLITRGYKAERSAHNDNVIYVDGGELISSNSYKQGLFSIQDEASLETVKALDPKPGDTVLDVCAAPGGKTMAIAERMENYGSIYAFDIYRKKLQEIIEQATRLGIEIVTVKSWDATVANHAFQEKADKVLVDAPCSGLGTIRKKPEIKYKAFDDDMKDLPVKQLKILNASAEYVKPGGTLVYSTCTIAKRENQNIPKAFLKMHKNFEKVYEKQLLPSVDGTDGFYICKMIKKDDIYA
ncbi:MAG: 16S rRNA (cytosine(967)-C(5))-methyltransferase RsmB [Clostridiales Family XIII bacterium]|nr:16S rRNA (cytosine(967)-C(5))-methyltransferase RsmB [Clostridiales Family XIII bacterium]